MSELEKVELTSPVHRDTFRRFLRQMWKHKAKMLTIWFGLAVVVTVETIQPFVWKNLYDQLIGRADGWEDSVSRSFWQIVAIQCTIWTSWRIMGVCNAFFQPKIIAELLLDSYDYIMRHSHNFFANEFLGSVVTRIRRFAYAFEAVDDVSKWEIGRTFMSCLAIQIAFIAFKPYLVLVMISWSAFYIWFAYRFSKFKMPYDLQVANQDTLTTAHLADTITNFSNVHRFGAIDREVDNFASIVDKLHRLRRKSWLLGQGAEAIQGFVMTSLLLGMIYYCLKQVMSGAYTIGDFVVVQQILGITFYYLWDLGRNIRSLYERFADANEMTVMLNIPHEIVDAPDAHPLKVSAGVIEFRDVGFSYSPEQPVFKGFNLRIGSGERVALVGKSGAGKTTFVKLLLRSLETQSGQILIDGSDISRVTLKSLRESISVVLQDITLRHMSIGENIRYPRPKATDDEVIAAAKASHCDQFVSKLEKGYKTLVGERGLKLSGGQRQRVAIAQAFLQNAPIMVLDEATSSLDSETECCIQESLGLLMRGRTTIVIAHRLSTIKQMDRILVLSESGEIIEQGSHDELIAKKDGAYRDLWHIQAGGFANSFVA